jgi:LynF/TruF/PatF family peptide O-prenyltransferase
MNPLIQAYTLYKKDFCLGESKLLGLFEKLVSESPCSILECGPQISPEGIHAARFRVGYVEKNNPMGLDAISQFLDKISEYKHVHLNRALLGRIVDEKFDLLRIGKLGIGVDLRENRSDSKLKFYFTIKDYPEKLDQVLAIHPPVDRIDAYPTNDMFGINIYLDGRTDLEIYPSLTAADCANMALLEKLRLQDISHDFLSACTGIFVSFDVNGSRVFHFCPHSPTRFVRMIDNRQLNAVYGNAQIISHLVDRSNTIDLLHVAVSIPEHEMLSREIRHINLALNYQLSHHPKSKP